LGDLRGFTRDLMWQVEQDLDTWLDWIAVDHHNTGHPRTHIIVRGITDDGRILNIAGDYRPRHPSSCERTDDGSRATRAR
jgi:type IV secretory pathway VirD2 relaxase